MPNLDEVLVELRELNKSVPYPLSLPNESEVAAVERSNRISFHPDMRRYLLEASDVVFGGLELATIGGGHTDFEGVLRSARLLGIPPELIPLCEDNSDFYCIAPSGEVVFWSHNGVSDETWPDLATWISEVWIAGN